MTEENKELPDSLNNLKMLSNQLSDLKAEKDNLDGRVSELETKIKDIQKEMLQVMSNAGMESFRTPRGLFYTHTATRARVLNPEAAFEFLRENNLGGLIKETVNANSLSSDIRRLAEEGAIALEDLEANGIGVFIDESVRIRK